MANFAKFSKKTARHPALLAKFGEQQKKSRNYHQGVMLWGLSSVREKITAAPPVATARRGLGNAIDFHPANV
ncbi:MAG: hypothetical protein KAR11_01820 [Phycisphaerae bacterium]|nr:hypothetical protein [Phycisphaerae bacterium]